MNGLLSLPRDLLHLILGLLEDRHRLCLVSRAADLAVNHFRMLAVLQGGAFRDSADLVQHMRHSGSRAGDPTLVEQFKSSLPEPYRGFFGSLDEELYCAPQSVSCRAEYSLIACVGNDSKKENTHNMVYRTYDGMRIEDVNVWVNLMEQQRVNVEARCIARYLLIHLRYYKARGQGRRTTLMLLRFPLCFYSTSFDDYDPALRCNTGKKWRFGVESIVNKTINVGVYKKEQPERGPWRAAMSMKFCISEEEGLCSFHIGADAPSECVWSRQVGNLREFATVIDAWFPLYYSALNNYSLGLAIDDYRNSSPYQVNYLCGPSLTPADLVSVEMNDFYEFKFRFTLEIPDISDLWCQLQHLYTMPAARGLVSVNSWLQSKRLEASVDFESLGHIRAKHLKQMGVAGAASRRALMRDLHQTIADNKRRKAPNAYESFRRWLKTIVRPSPLARAKLQALIIYRKEWIMAQLLDRAVE